MDKVLEKIENGEYDGEPPPKKLPFIFAPRKKITDEKRKEQWYKIGKVIKRGHKVKLHKESQLAARRTYEYYSIGHGNWIGPTPRQFGKMYKSEFEEYLQQRQKVQDQVLFDYFLAEEDEVEGPTFASGGNMLESQRTPIEDESRDNNMWECDVRSESQEIIGSLDVGHEGIGDC